MGAAVLATTVLAVAPAAGEPADTAYPQLHGVTMSAPTVAAGGSITAVVDATDDGALSSVSIRFVHTALSSHVINVTRVWPVEGRLTVPVPSAVAGGTYRVDFVSLGDQTGKSAQYVATERQLVLDPTVASGPFTHDLDLTAVTFGVTGGADVIPPRITAISMPVRPAEEDQPGTLSVSVDDTGPVRVVAWWDQPYEPGSRWGEVTAQGGTGVLTFRLGPAGTHRLSGIQVSDAAGNMRSYRRDGRELWGASQTTHTWDLPRFDVTVTPQKPLVAATAHPASVRVVLTADESEARAITGWRIVVNPGNVVREVPVKVGATQVDVGGLTNGTAYTVSVTARSAVGDSKPGVSVARPMQSTNVFAIADAGGDGQVDIVARRPMTAADLGDSHVYPTNGKGVFGRPFRAYRADEMTCPRVAPGDIYIVGDSEVLCFGPALTALRIDGSGSEIGTAGWSSMRFVDGGQDLTGDGWPDIVGVTPEGVLKIYQTRDQSRIVSTTTLGSGWNAFTALFQVGDFSGDRRADLVAVDTAGTMWLYPGNGLGGFGRRVQIGTGWAGLGAVLPLRDFTGDGRADIGAITLDGRLFLYPGNGRSGFLTKRQIGSGWGVFL
ncbi:hypothetical protein N798_13510 [Knoellia flava TL1]|uniref:Fibronectin type-III domain-containing protein n=1 Tax=Knoellia flava TL1 TaxID=1385518 RepID=A0ABR4XCL3_9MICO|nr:hypothetical protein N798_13510 [Knoellia flava TL1]